jgi:hypothetical protein
MVREKFKNLPNAYCLVHFACCREIKKKSKLEVEKLSGQRGEGGENEPEEEVEETKEQTG